jgi:hypothetical protein
MATNRPYVDTGWRVGMPTFILNGGNQRISKTIEITCLDGKNRKITLTGIGRPEWNTIDR